MSLCHTRGREPNYQKLLVKMSRWVRTQTYVYTYTIYCSALNV